MRPRLEPVSDGEVRELIAETRRLAAELSYDGIPPVFHYAAAVEDVLERYLADRRQVDPDELLGLERLSSAGGRWRTEHEGGDPFADARGRRVDLLRRIGDEIVTSRQQFAESNAQSEQHSVVERRSKCNVAGEMIADPKQHRCDKIAFHLQRLREESGLTQEQLETQIGVTHGHVSRWESALWEPRPASLARLCDFFGVEEAEFFREPAPC